MVLQQNYGGSSWKILATLTTILFLSGCSSLLPETKIVTATKVEQVQIATVARPKPLQLTDTRIFVVTKDNFDEFEKEFTEKFGEFAFVALSMKDYENLALNIAEIKRYLEQQEQVIIYYEEAIKPPEK